MLLFLNGIFYDENSFYLCFSNAKVWPSIVFILKTHRGIVGTKALHFLCSFVVNESWMVNKNVGKQKHVFFIINLNEQINNLKTT